MGRRGPWKAGLVRNPVHKDTVLIAQLNRRATALQSPRPRTQRREPIGRLKRRRRTGDDSEPVRGEERIRWNRVEHRVRKTPSRDVDRLISRVQQFNKLGRFGLIRRSVMDLIDDHRTLGLEPPYETEQERQSEPRAANRVRVPKTRRVHRGYNGFEWFCVLDRRKHERYTSPMNPTTPRKNEFRKSGVIAECEKKRRAGLVPVPEDEFSSSRVGPFCGSCAFSRLNPALPIQLPQQIETGERSL